MNIYSIIYLVNVFLIVKTEYETIELKLEKNDFYIPIKLGPNDEEDYFLLSTMLPINFFPSSKCSQCHYHINEKDPNYYTLIQSNFSLLYYYFLLSGDLYSTNITLGTETSYNDIILAVDQIDEIDIYNGKGRYSLSFLNYFFNTTNKTFALYLSTEISELHLGGYNKARIEKEDKLIIFNISKTNNNNFWFINFDSLYIKSKKLPETNIKLTFDLNAEYLHIPKDFFFANANLIFPLEARCQVQPEGYFVCFCNELYNQRFSSFIFTNENNNKIEITPDDYIFFDNSGADNYCYVYIMLNYENDFFIAGKYVMSNYYNIFDVGENQLKLYPIKKESDEFYKERNIIILLVLLLAGFFLFIAFYLIYRKYFTNNQNEEDFNIADYDNIENEIDVNNLEQVEGNNNNNYEEEVGIIDRNNNENNEENENDNIINNINNEDNNIVFDGRESNIIN